ncbi:MAG: PKD domain-containing protein, partial [Candidatus Thermoplasmatota archaeon]
MKLFSKSFIVFIIAFLILSPFVQFEKTNAERDRATTVIGWANNPPAIDGKISAGEWNNALKLNISYQNFSCFAYLMNDEYNFYVYIDAVSDKTNDASSQEVMQIAIDGDNDGKITYTDPDGDTDGDSDFDPITLGGPVVDRWADIDGLGNANAGWLNLDGTKAQPTPLLWYVKGGVVNQGKQEPYDYIARGFSTNRFYEYSIPIKTVLNRTMGDKIGITILCNDYNASSPVTVGLLPSDSTYSVAGPYAQIQLNQKPIIVISSPKEDEIYETAIPVVFDASKTIDNAHLFLTFNWDFGDGSVGAGAKVSHAYSKKGTYVVSLKVTNEEGLFSSKKINVTINAKPVIVSYLPSTNSINVKENSTTTFMVSANDIDNDALTYSWYFDFVFISNATNSLSYFFDFLSSGEHKVNATVSDGMLKTFVEWDVFVEDVNCPPIIKWYKPNISIEIAEGEKVKFEVYAYDIDGNLLSYKWYLNDKYVASDMNYTFSSDYTSAGEWNIKVEVSDGSLITSVIWNLKVRETNRAPIITNYMPKEDPTINEGESIDFSVEANDPDGDELSYTWYVDEKEVGKGKKYKYLPGFNESLRSPYLLKVFVTDTLGANASFSWTIT